MKIPRNKIESSEEKAKKNKFTLTRNNKIGINYSLMSHNSNNTKLSQTSVNTPNKVKIQSHKYLTPGINQIHLGNKSSKKEQLNSTSSNASKTFNKTFITNETNYCKIKVKLLDYYY